MAQPDFSKTQLTDIATHNGSTQIWLGNFHSKPSNVHLCSSSGPGPCWMSGCPVQTWHLSVAHIQAQAPDLVLAERWLRFWTQLLAIAVAVLHLEVDPLGQVEVGVINRFKRKSTGNHGFYHYNPLHMGFPVDFPVKQSIDISTLMWHHMAEWKFQRSASFLPVLFPGCGQHRKQWSINNTNFIIVGSYYYFLSFAVIRDHLPLVVFFYHISYLLCIY